MIKNQGSSAMKSSLLFQYAWSRFLRFVVAAELLILTALAFSIFSRMPSSNALLSAARSASPSDSARTEEKHFIKWVDFMFSVRDCMEAPPFMRSASASMSAAR